MGQNTFDHKNFSQQDLSQQEFNGSTFSYCNFAGANLRSAELSDCEFHHCEFNDRASELPADLSYANIRHSCFYHCNLTVVDAIHMKAYGARFEQCQMQGLDLQYADFCMPVAQSNLVDLHIQDCNLSFANLSHCYLSQALIKGCRCIEVCLDYADLTGAEIVDCELHGLQATGLTIVDADLRGSAFNNLNPTVIDMTGVRLDPEQLMYLAEALGIVVESRA